MATTAQWAALAAAALCLTNCSSAGDSPDGSDGDTASWNLAPDQNISPATTEFTAIVTRTGCSSGKQGKPVEPTVTVGETQISITFLIKPHIDNGTCEGTPGVPYQVRLEEPVGTRMLVDGACQPGTGLSSTAFCLHDGVRLTWKDGEPKPQYGG